MWKILLSDPRQEIAFCSEINICNKFKFSLVISIMKRWAVLVIFTALLSTYCRYFPLHSHKPHILKYRVKLYSCVATLFNIKSYAVFEQSKSLEIFTEYRSDIWSSILNMNGQKIEIRNFSMNFSMKSGLFAIFRFTDTDNSAYSLPLLHSLICVCVCVKV